MKHDIPVLISPRAAVKSGLLQIDQTRLAAHARATGMITGRVRAVMVGKDIRIPFRPLCEELGITLEEAMERIRATQTWRQKKDGE